MGITASQGSKAVRHVNEVKLTIQMRVISSSCRTGIFGSARSVSVNAITCSMAHYVSAIILTAVIFDNDIAIDF